MLKRKAHALSFASYSPIFWCLFIMIISLIFYFVLDIFKSSIDLNNYIATILSSFTVIISCGAYKHTQEQFRLELLDKRYEIYAYLYDFFKFINSNHNIYSKGMTKEKYETMNDLACKSFLGEGNHKSIALFGKDIEDFLEKVRKSYVYLISSPPSGDNAPIYSEKFAELRDMRFELVKIFHPYVYFGDYKNQGS